MALDYGVALRVTGAVSAGTVVFCSTADPSVARAVLHQGTTPAKAGAQLESSA